MMNVCHKDILAKIMNIWSEICPEEYDFVPKTFICPEQLSQAASYIESKIKKDGPKPTYIVKPAQGT